MPASDAAPVTAIKLPLPPGALVATVASAAMIAQQVAGKAARDALFLSSVHITKLPAMMAAAAVLSLLAVLWLSRMILRHTPAVVVPAIFAASAVALVGEWALSFPLPRVAAVVLYLHTALFGAAVISAFWSLINEHFDPHTGKRAVTWIAGGGTLGGVIGGVVAWRAASTLAVPTMLPILAAVNLVCMGCTWRLRGATTAPAPAPANAEPPTPARPVASPVRVLLGAPYLRNLSLVVALGAVTSGLLDYVFSSQAAERFSKGPALLSFFALFWLAIGVLSFALQMLFGRIALEKLGLAVTVALLPAVVVLGGAFGLAVPGLWSTAILRGAEASQRNSLFRAAYELLYTPLSEEMKRSTKTVIDVGFDRLGTVAASGIVVLSLALSHDRADGVLLFVAVGCAIVTLVRTRALHRGYVVVLEESLAAQELPAPHDDRATEEPAEAREAIIEEQKELPNANELVAIVKGDAVEVPPPATVPADDGGENWVDLARFVADVRSGSADGVRRALATKLTAPGVALAILLLADKTFHTDAARALCRAAPKNIGQLVDALCDPDVAFDIRRRIPRVLRSCPTQFAADGLVRGTADERFEVRYECGRALLRMVGPESEVVVGMETVIAIVQREISLSKDIWESQPALEIEDEEDEQPSIIDRLLRDRIDRSLEHVFTILALYLDPSALRIAFQALHQDDMRLRGTALEYLQTVLPDEVRDGVWPFLGEARPLPATRSAEEILEDLVRARHLAGRLPGPASENTDQP